MTAERLQKIMANSGIASRRACEAIILEGRVTVDGVAVTELGTRVDPALQRIEVDGEPLVRERPVVYVINKPRGVICTVRDPGERPTVLDYFKNVPFRLYPIGRLDFNTSGALLLTNDGDLANALTHPKFGAEKQYLIKFHGVVSDTALEAWRNGITLEDGTRTRPIRNIARVEESDGSTWVHVVLKEGKNRQIRRMADATGLQVSKLKRVAFAGITIDKLPIGRYRKLTAKELNSLLKQFDLTLKDYVNHDPPVSSAGRSDRDRTVRRKNPATAGKWQRAPHAREGSVNSENADSARDRKQTAAPPKSDRTTPEQKTAPTNRRRIVGSPQSAPQSRTRTRSPESSPSAPQSRTRKKSPEIPQSAPQSRTRTRSPESSPSAPQSRTRKKSPERT